MQEEICDQVEFLWNDVAEIHDENCYFVICKTMAALPKERPEIERLEDAEIKDIPVQLQKMRGNAELSGEILVNVSYRSTQGSQENMAFAVPFCAQCENSLMRGSVLQENYMATQAVGARNLLLETVLSVPRGNLSRDASRQIGRFQQEYTVKLPQDWPEMEQIVGTKLEYSLIRTEQTQKGMILYGEAMIGILYVNQEQNGEKIIFYQQKQPFSVQLAQKTLPQDVKICYYSLSAEIVNEREILLQSYGELRVALQERSQILPEEIEEPEEAEDRAEDDAADAEEAELKKEETGKNMSENAAVGRKNRRESLQRYMRRLDKGVKTAYAIRNIELEKE